LIERPPCPQCRAQMMLSRIRPQSLGTDERTYQCSRCRFVETLLTEHRA
jgi:transposase-like protein